LARDRQKACRLLREHLKRTADVVASYWEGPRAAGRRTKN
jgi:hypothetical protein